MAALLNMVPYQLEPLRVSTGIPYASLRFTSESPAALHQVFPALASSLRLHTDPSCRVNKKGQPWLPFSIWCRHTDSNREPTDYKSVALPIVLCRQCLVRIHATFWRTEPLRGSLCVPYTSSVRAAPGDVGVGNGL
jgi:hypothetical protein